MNVEELLTHEKISFKPSGNDFLVSCLNPDHEDNNPSMRIDKVLGIFNCLACGYKGNIFNFYGIKPHKLDLARERLKRKINKIRQDSVGYPLPKDMIPYIGTWRGISAETYIKFEAFKSAEPHFINRIVFPIRDITRKIVCFMGRDDTGTLQKRYLIHPGGVTLPLFPQVFPTLGRIVIVEGIFDMLNLHDKGMLNAVTTFGCNTVKEDSFDLVKLQGVTGVDILYDADDAGKAGAEVAKEIIEASGLEAIIRSLPAGKDPGELTFNQVQKLREIMYG